MPWLVPLHFVRAIFLNLLFSVSALAMDTSDWDWGAVEELDDSPIVAPRRDSMPKRTVPAPPPIAAPDPEGDIQPAYALFREMPSFEVTWKR